MEKYLQCPRCKIKMKKLKEKKVTLDICRKCGGMWVDAGELETLSKRVKT